MLNKQHPVIVSRTRRKTIKILNIERPLGGRMEQPHEGEKPCDQENGFPRDRASDGCIPVLIETVLVLMLYLVQMEVTPMMESGLAMKDCLEWTIFIAILETLP
jgi:hypothetical protein